jgi:D-glycero-alpha-D-manno-heptose-7-phosphate kinase
VAERFEGDVRVSYSKTETVDNASAIEHDLVREAMRLTGVPRGVDVVTLADVPARGTGLGSSSTVTVGLLNALYGFQGTYKSPSELAEEAARIEIEILDKPIGRQDQYAAAIGGFNLIEFLPRGGGVSVEPVITPLETLKRVQRSLLLFFTGRQRSADDILNQQRTAVSNGDATQALLKMRDLAYEMRERLGAGDADSVGALLHENWMLKRSLATAISDPQIDAWYDATRDAGATGGKILGAGAGGFLLVFAAPERHDKVRAALRELREVPLRFASHGTQVTVLSRNGNGA